MNTRIATGLVAGVALLASGCATITYDAATVEGIVALNRVAPPAAYERVGEFQAERRAGFLIFDLITVMDADLDAQVRRELARTGGDAVLNLRIHEVYGPLDVLIGVAQSVLLLGGRILGTRTVTLRGDIVRWVDRSGMLEHDVGRLADACRALRVEEPGGPDGPTAERTGYICAATPDADRSADP